MRPESDADDDLQREDDLHRGLADLARVVEGAAPLGQLLSEVAEAAVQAISNADGVGITLLTDEAGPRRVQALAASEPFVSEVDALQYGRLDEGPSITAVYDRVPIRVGNVGRDPRWPRFGPRAARLGIHSVLALPLLLGDGSAVGAINAYSHSHNAFDEQALGLAQLFAAPAVSAVHNAQLLARAQTRAAQLQQALGSRSVIDQAIGIVRSRSGGSAEEAFARLRELSQHSNVKLARVAEQLVNEAVRTARARSRHADRDP